MTKRHLMACHDPSSWSFGVKAEIFSSLGQKERLRAPKIPIEVTCLLSLLACGKPICGAGSRRGIRIGIFRRDVL